MAVSFGLTAFKLVERLAALDALDRWTVALIGEEPYPAYARVHLTERLHRGDLRPLTLGRPGWSERSGVRIVTGDPVTGIDRDDRLNPPWTSPYLSSARRGGMQASAQEAAPTAPGTGAIAGPGGWAGFVAVRSSHLRH